MQPQPNPLPHSQYLPTARVPRPRKSRTGLWILLSLVLLGAASAGGYVLFRGDGAAEEASSASKDGFDMAAWENDDPMGDDDDDDDDDGTDEAASSLNLDGIVYTTYTDSSFNYQVRYPNFFDVQRFDASAVVYTGAIRGHMVQILSMAWHPRNDSETAIEAEIAMRLAQVEVLVESMRWLDHSTLVGEVEVEDTGVRGEMVLVRQRGAVFLVAIGSPESSLAATSAYRQKFLAEDVQFFY